jgi:putative transposase
MSLPRRIRPNATVMITRRTVRRTHLLRPDARLNALFTYCLAVLAKRHGILIHAVVVMSTHEHIVLTDVHGCLPRFLQQLHRTLALCIKVLRRWEGAVWDHEKTSVVELLTGDAVAQKIAYVMANPVAAGLVRRARDWPGLQTLPNDLGTRTWTSARPDYYFDARNPDWPPAATLELVLPPAFVDSATPLRDEVTTELERAEKEAQAELRDKGWRPLAPEQLRRLSPFRRARSWEPLRARNPTFAVGRGQRAAFFAAVSSLREFRARYRAALERWRMGLRDALFPSGTWAMQQLHAASVAAA